MEQNMQRYFNKFSPLSYRLQSWRPKLYKMWGHFSFRKFRFAFLENNFFVLQENRTNILTLNKKTVSPLLFSPRKQLYHLELKYSYSNLHISQSVERKIIYKEYLDLKKEF